VLHTLRLIGSVLEPLKFIISASHSDGECNLSAVIRIMVTVSISTPLVSDKYSNKTYYTMQHPPDFPGNSRSLSGPLVTEALGISSLAS
jgi:hypothetical protein